MVPINNLKIRFADISDTKYLIKWLDDEDILRWFPMCNKPEVDDAVRIWMSFAKYRAVLTATIDDIPCGSAIIYLQSYEKLSHQALFGIIVDKEYRGKGIRTALIKEVMKIAKEDFKLELLHLEVYEGNPAFSLYERLGFKKYGVHKKFLKDSNGKYYDKILMQKPL